MGDIFHQTLPYEFSSIHSHMKYSEFTLKLGAKNEEKFVTHDIFEVIPFSPQLSRNLFVIFSIAS